MDNRNGDYNQNLQENEISRELFNDILYGIKLLLNVGEKKTENGLSKMIHLLTIGAKRIINSWFPA